MRFSTFLLLFILIFSIAQHAKSQNLIADWSAEEYETCPTGLALTQFIPTWLSFRGNPDYFNTCSPNLGPLTNPFGWQHPKTGEGLMGVITYHPGFVDGREYAGVELIEALSIGQSYDVSFFVATSYSVNPWATGRATNKIGALFMTENYLDSNELGPIPNFAHCNVDSLLIDTAEWIEIKATVFADSAYKFVAFGNFFDDANTLDSLLMDREFTALAYYYFDDFCVVPEGGDCLQVLSSTTRELKRTVQIFPNPADEKVEIISSSKVRKVTSINPRGQFSNMPITVDSSQSLELQTSTLESGLYVLIIETEEGIERKKIVIQH